MGVENLVEQAHAVVHTLKDDRPAEAGRSSALVGPRTAPGPQGALLDRALQAGLGPALYAAGTSSSAATR